MKSRQIFFIKSDKNYIDIHTLNKIISVRSSLDDFLEKLDKSTFYKVHRSYILNKTKISKKNASSVIINSFKIPLSRNLDFDL